MAQHATHKSGEAGKRTTIAHRRARALKHGAAYTNRNGR